MGSEEKKEETLALKVPMSSASSRYEIAQIIKNIKGIELVSIDFDEKKVIVKGKKIDKEKVLRDLSLATGTHVQLWPQPANTVVTPAAITPSTTQTYQCPCMLYTTPQYFSQNNSDCHIM